jgi:hypothetical protein
MHFISRWVGYVRTFPTHHLLLTQASALQSISLSELIDIDKTYQDQIVLRRQILDNEFTNVAEYNPIATDAVHELYDWMFRTYLPKRYPTMFSLTGKGTLLNKVLHEQIPLTPPSNPLTCLKTLGSHIDTDFLILLPASDANGLPFRTLPTADPPCPYHLHAYILCFPSGFNTPKKFGHSLSEIHNPVPGYAQKIERSMDRFFATLPFGKIVKRANWAVQQDATWFKLSGNHLSTTSSSSPAMMAPPTHEPTEEEVKVWEEQGERVVPEKCMLRSERQTLHRLERTGALVFAFKTYLYPLPEVKSAGLGEEMAAAVEGLWKGSVPAMAVYKRGVVWGRRVVEYLRARAEEV